NELWGEARNTREVQLLAFGERIPHPQLAVIREPDDVACKRFLGDLPVLSQEQQRTDDLELSSAGDVSQLLAALEVTRDEPDERHTISVLRIHVRLDLEHEAADRLFLGLHESFGCLSAAR